MAAAVDALHYARESAGRQTVERGGVIVATAGGFTYAAPTSGGANVIQLALSDDAVAWYVARREVRPSKRTRADEHLSWEARRMVDQVDPQRRPYFVLTPGEKVLTYNDLQVARVEAPSQPVANQDDR